MSGTEEWSAEGGPHGALVLHGFTGNPHSMRGLAEAFAAADYAVELPRLPGHGTVIEDMVPTRFDDWSACAEDAYQRLAGRLGDGGRLVLVGLSMGGTLATWLAAGDAEAAGLVVVNPSIEPPGEPFFDILRQTLASGIEVAPGIAGDIADPAQSEVGGYQGTPIAAGLSLMEAQRELAPRLADITCPVLIMTSRQDHAVPTNNSDYLADHVGGPVERVWLERSYHVATLDYDRDEVVRRALEFAAKVTSA